MLGMNHDQNIIQHLYLAGYLVDTVCQFLLVFLKVQIVQICYWDIAADQRFQDQLVKIMSLFFGN